MRSKINVCLGAALVVLILSGCKPAPTPVKKPSPAPRPVVQKPVDIAAQSWKAFVADARSKCEKNPACTLDYNKLHEQDGSYFGVTVTGFKESEYYVDLFRFDPKSDKWIRSPLGAEELNEVIDVPATSKQWEVPERTIQQWIDEADKTVKEIYSKRR